MKLKVIADEGRYITGYGSRECGEIFDNLPDGLAEALLKHQPDKFERVEEETEEESED